MSTATAIAACVVLTGGKLPTCLEPLIKELRWIVWRFVDAPNGRRTKPPFRADDPSVHAKSNDPQTWASYDVAMQACANGLADGIGFALMNSGLAAFDLDNCRDPESGVLAAWARQLVERSGTYAEVTPSKRGIRIIGKASGDKLHRKLPAPDGASLEVYRGAVERYITISGDTLTPDVEQLGDIDAICDQVVAEFDKKKPSPQPPSPRQPLPGGDDRTLEDLIKNGCGTSFGGDKSRAVWRAINLMLDEGRGRDEIARVLTDPVNGISVHCLSKPGDPAAYALKQIDKAANERAGTANDDLEITRLAKLKPQDYDRERTTAAEEMGCRVGTLDKLVQVERVRYATPGDDLRGRAVTLPEPEPWQDPIDDGAKLADAIAIALRDYVVLSDHAKYAATCWVLHAHMAEVFLISPRLSISSATKGCGKSTAVDVIARLVPRPLQTSNVSSSAIFRAIEKFKPCLLCDEADTYWSRNGGDDTLRGILNSGHRKGGAVLRTVAVGDDFDVRAFSTFGPCVLACIGTLPETLHDRSILIELNRRRPGHPDEQIKSFRPDRAGHLDTLARQAARWAWDHAVEVAATDPALPEGVINRQADNWRTLKMIATVLGGEWPERIDAAAKAALAKGGEDAASRLEQLLADIRDTDFPEDGGASIKSADLVKQLIGLDGRPWAEMGKSQKPLTQNRLARLLKPLAIAPGFIGPEDGRARGYRRQHFEEAFARYLPPAQPCIRAERDGMGTFDISKPCSTDDGCTDEKFKKPNNDGPLHGCTVAKRGDSQGEDPAKPAGDQGLEMHTIQRLARWYLDCFELERKTANGGDDPEAQGRIDVALRKRLLDEYGVFREHVTTEFNRVMDVVFQS